MLKPSLDQQQDIFRELQQAERDLWDISLAVSTDEYEVSRTLAQRGFFLAQREPVRQEIAERHDLSAAQLREIELRGVQDGWPRGVS